MHNRSTTDRDELVKLLNISDTQPGHITNVPEMPPKQDLQNCANIQKMKMNVEF